MFSVSALPRTSHAHAPEIAYGTPPSPTPAPQQRQGSARVRFHPAPHFVLFERKKETTGEIGAGGETVAAHGGVGHGRGDDTLTLGTIEGATVADSTPPRPTHRLLLSPMPHASTATSSRSASRHRTSGGRRLRMLGHRPQGLGSRAWPRHGVTSRRTPLPICKISLPLSLPPPWLIRFGGALGFGCPDLRCFVSVL